MTTKTEWLSGRAFTSTFNGRTIDIDGDEGFRPKALLLSGLAACSGIDVVEVLEKMRVPFASLKIDAEADQTDDHPRVFTDIHIRYMLTADEEYRDKIVKAINLSLDKYCGVAAMLKKNSEIRYTLILQAEGS